MTEDEDAAGAVAARGTRRFLHIRPLDLAGLSNAEAAAILEQYGKLVPHVAAKYHLPRFSRAPYAMDDLHAMGYVTLLQTWVHYFDDARASFSTVAVRRLHQLFYTVVREARGVARDQRGPEPDVERVPLMYSIENFVQESGWVASRSAVLEDALTDHAELESDADVTIQYAWMQSRLACLSARERQVLEASIHRHLTPTEAAAHFGISHQRIEQLLTMAQRKLAYLAWDEGLTEDAKEPCTKGLPVDLLLARRDALRDPPAKVRQKAAPRVCTRQAVPTRAQRGTRSAHA